MPGKYPGEISGIWKQTCRAFGNKYPKTLNSISPTRCGQSYGGSKRMERNMLAGGSDLTRNGARNPLEKSTISSGQVSPHDQAKDVTLTVAPKPNDLNLKLSILRTAYEQALVAGLKAQSRDLNGHLVLVLHEVIKCPICTEWRSSECPTCAQPE